MEIITLQSKYNAKKESYEKLQTKIEFLVAQEIERKKIKIHSITPRIKPFDSLYKKIIRKNIKNPFEEVKDIVGLRIICLYFSDLKKVEKIVSKIFNISEIENKINNNEPNIFDYMAIHLIAKLKEENDLKIADIPFEIQIKTICQDAWASISHPIYKGSIKISTKEQRSFNAISALFYIADIQFEIIREGLIQNLKI